MLVDGEAGMAVEVVTARRKFTREASATVSPQAFPDVALMLAEIFA